MNLSDFIPTSDQFASIQGIERKLLERRHASILSAAFAILLAVVQLVLVLANKVTLPPVEKLLSWHEIGKFLHSPEGLLLLGLFMAASIFLIVRDLRAHIHIEGDYAIREEDDDDHWTLHVWPRVTSYTPSPENKDKNKFVVAIEAYNKARTACEKLPRFHYELSLLLQGQQRLCENSDGQAIDKMIGVKGRLIVDPFTALNWNVISGADYIDKFRQASKHPLSEERTVANSL